MKTAERKELIDSKLLTVKETAAQLRLGKSKVYGMLQTGDLPHLRVGAALRIPQAAVDQLKDRSLVGAG
jgi:excisionase family DNA binding protein